MAVLDRLLLTLAGLMGAAGVALAALAAHAGDGSRLAPAAQMLLVHAPAVLAAVALIGQGWLGRRLGRAAALGLALGPLLFAADLGMRHVAGHALFPMAAPTGGSLAIIAWLVLALAALARRGRIG
jgi:uncharacterized membrane protein YgdD (TMEM256/DUF423 family)